MYNLLHKPSRKYFALQFQKMMDGSFLDGVVVYKYLGENSALIKRLAGLMNCDDNPRDLGITNLTRVDIPQNYGSYRLGGLTFVAPVVPYTSRTIGVVTLGDEMTVTLHAIADEVEQEKVFFERLMKNIKEGSI